MSFSVVIKSIKPQLKARLFVLPFTIFRISRVWVYSSLVHADTITVITCVYLTVESIKHSFHEVTYYLWNTTSELQWFHTFFYKDSWTMWRWHRFSPLYVPHSPGTFLCFMSLPPIFFVSLYCTFHCLKYFFPHDHLQAS